MKSSVVLCSVYPDLHALDKAHLRMNNVMATDSLSNALEPMIEGEATTLIITDKIIEEQSSLSEIVHKLEVIYSVYPKEIRVIYLKLGGEEDSLVKLMDKFSNWDVYYNSELPVVRTEGVIKMLSERKTPDSSRKQGDVETIKMQVIDNANNFQATLMDTLKETHNFNHNNEFRSLMIKNPNLVRDVVLAYGYLKEEVLNVRKEQKNSNNQIHQLSSSLKESKALNKELLTIKQNLEEDRREMYSHLLRLDATHNSLVDSLKEIADINNLNTLLSKAIDTETYGDRSPLIVYFKEITPISYFTTFLKYFNSMIMDSIGLSKILVIENDHHTFKLPLYEEKEFVHLTEGTNMGAMVLGNIVTFGNNLKLMNYLIQNSLNLDILFVYDRTGIAENLIIGEKVINFYLLKHLEDASVLRMTSNNIISNDKKAKYFLGKINEYEDIKGNSELEMSIMSSLDITKKLTSYIMNWNKIESSDVISVDITKKEVVSNA